MVAHDIDCPVVAQVMQTDVILKHRKQQSAYGYSSRKQEEEEEEGRM